MGITGVGIQGRYGIGSTDFAAYKSQQVNMPTGQSSVRNTDTVSLSKEAKSLAASASQNTEPSTLSSRKNTTFSDYAEKMMNLRGVSTEQKDIFANIMQRAERQVQNPEDAKRFLASLSGDELAAVQKVHSLADQIDPQNLNMEGAYNLLHQPGDVRDFNDDGFVKIGKATTFVFPPPNSPQSVKDAWQEATANMSDEEKMKATMSFLPSPDIRQSGDSYIVVEPNDPNYSNPYKIGSSYLEKVKEALESNEVSKPWNSKAAYEETKAFLETFLVSLEKHNCY